MKSIRTIIKAVALAGLAGLPAQAIAQVDFFGYFESEGDLLRLRSENYYLGFNKLRIDMEASPSESIEIGANLIAQFYHGRLNIDPVAFLPDRLISEYQALVAQLPAGEAEPFLVDETFLDNAYLRLSKSWWDLTLGRQQVSVGVGYTWNPTDIFNLKSLVDPTYEQRGVDAIRMDVMLPLELGLMAVVQPDESVAASTQYYQLKRSLGGADASLVYVHTMPDNDDYRDLLGLNIEGELAGIGLRTEFAANWFSLNDDELTLEYIIGADYTTESSLYLLGEFLHNDFGLENNTGNTLDYLSYFSGQKHSLNQNYLFLLGQYPASDVMIVGAFAIANLDDGSMLFAPDIQYSLMESVDLSANIIFSSGDNETEFGLQTISARIRLRAYF